MLLKGEALRAIARFSHIGFLFGALTVGGFFLGRLIDNTIRTFPVFSILLFLLGLFLGIYKFILMIGENGSRKEKGK